MTPQELSERMWRFAARVGKAVNALPENRVGRHVAGQLVRSGTSAPPNYDEGSAAESRRDFIHKLGIVFKELKETSGWLHYIVISDLLPERRIAPLQTECEELLKIIASSLLTAKGKRRPRRDPSSPESR
jgi:four helix bundle protein